MVKRICCFNCIRKQTCHRACPFKRCTPILKCWPCKDYTEKDPIKHWFNKDKQ